MCSTYTKLMEKNPATIVGYNIGRLIEQRNKWIQMARESQFPENRTARARFARERNHDLLKLLRAL